MRRLFVAFIVVTVAFMLVGCGGGDDEAAEPTTPAATTPEAPSGGGGEAAEEDIEDNSPLVEGYPMPFPNDPTKVPADILERIDEGQPLFIYYFDEDHLYEDDLDEAIEDVTSEYRGLIHKIEYGIRGDIEDVVEDGMDIGADPGEDLTEEEQAERKKVYRLAEELGILHTPFIILVDREGTIVWMHRGYVDAKTLELEVLYATQ